MAGRKPLPRMKWLPSAKAQEHEGEKDLDRFLIGFFAGGVALFSASTLAAPAAAQDANFGRSVWLSQANCAACHGWFGDGTNEDRRSPRGANLRETSLDAEALVEVILCGLPGTAMPYFDHRAYTDDRCFGLTRADLAETTPPTSAMPLTKRHAQGLAQFILEEFVGKGEITAGECRDLLGADAARCAQYPEVAEAAPAEAAEPKAEDHGDGLH